jgi:hypothetical protein
MNSAVEDIRDTDESTSENTIKSIENKVYGVQRRMM